VLFVTHSIAEAVYLSDRVAVFTPRPGTIRTMIDVPLPRPRLPEVRRDPAFFRVEMRVLAALEGQHDEAMLP
jgi:NitT/TauT family transport system ATP-binding protein